MRIESLTPCGRNEKGEIVFVEGSDRLRFSIEYNSILTPIGDNWKSKTPKEVYLLSICAHYFYLQELFHPERAERFKRDNN